MSAGRRTNLILIIPPETDLLIGRCAFEEPEHCALNAEFKSSFGVCLSLELKQKFSEVLCQVLCHNLRCVIQSVNELGLEADFLTGE